MRKPNVKAAVKPKPKTVAVKKKNNQTNTRKKPNAQKAKVYPQWTSPKHLSDNDRMRLKRLYDLFTKGKFEVAYNLAAAFETIVREEIPVDIWKKIGGMLNERSMSKDQEPPPHQVADDAPDAIETIESVEVKFNSVDELENVIITNHNAFFGENVLFFYDKMEGRNNNYPDKFLLDFTNQDNPKLFLVEIVLPL